MKVEIEGEIGEAKFKITAEGEDAKVLADILLRLIQKVKPRDLKGE